MNIKTRMLFILYLSAGLFCIFVLVVSKYPDYAKKFIREDREKYGELYDLCKVRQFRIPLNEKLNISLKPSFTVHPLDECSVVFMGDSFFGGYMGGVFEKFTGVPAFDYRFDNIRATPLNVLEELKYKKNPCTRYVVFERLERSVGRRNVDPGFRAQREKTSMNDILRRFMVKDIALDFLVTENPLVNRLTEARNTLQFDVFREMTILTPVYSVDPPMLFSRVDVWFGQWRRSDRFIEEMADNVAALDRELMDKYGLKMIFVPMPNKYTLYGYDYGRYKYNISGEELTRFMPRDIPQSEVDMFRQNLTGGRYDDFLPRLYKKLDERGVLYIDLYHEFKRRYPRLMFDPTHAHWNDEAKKIFVSRLYELYEKQERLRRPGAEAAE